MQRDRRRDLEFPVRPHGLAGRHVPRRHRLARMHRGDRQQGEAKWAESLADGRKEFAEASIAGEVDAARAALDHESEPERAPLVVDPPRGPVLGGHTNDTHAWRERGGLPPIDVLRAGDTLAPKKRGVAETRDDSRMERRDEPPKRRHVHVVVMVVAQEYNIDRRKVLELYAWRPMTLRAVPTQRARTFRPYGVRKDIEAVHLDQHRCVIDERHAQRTDAHSPRWNVRGDFLPCRPVPAPPSQLSASASECIFDLVIPEPHVIMEPLTVEVIGRRTVISWRGKARAPGEPICEKESESQGHPATRSERTRRARHGTGTDQAIIPPP